MHFGMTGLLVWTSSDRSLYEHDRVVFRLRCGELRYRDQRRLGGIWLARSEAERNNLTGGLGPDALELDADSLRAILSARRGGIKSALMDQRLIAGLGNLLSDEILWRACIDPRKPARELGPRRSGRLHAAMEEVLRDSVRRGRVPPESGWLTRVRGLRDAHCPRCGAKLRRATIASRTAAWCPRCQSR
jgi:formamidopyrimidine-DNA glycosylase